MPTPIILPLIIKGIVWLGTAGITAYGVKKVTEGFGSTPANDAKKIPQLEKMSPKEMYQDRREWRKDRVKYHKEKQKGIQDEIDKLNKKIELENEERQKVLQKLKETSDPAEKIKLNAQLATIEKNLNNFQRQLNGKEKEKKESETKIDEVYNKFDDNLSQEQFVAQSNSINWTSYKNWGIIAICVVVGIMLIGFLKKLLGGLLKGMQ